MDIYGRASVYGLVNGRDLAAALASDVCADLDLALGVASMVCCPCGGLGRLSPWVWKAFALGEDGVQ